MGKMELRWLGHSCFVLEMDGYKVIFDPFTEGSVPGIPAIHEEVDLVLSSHSHGDHAGAAGVTLRKGKECPFAIEEIHSFHDECRGAKRGKNIIRVLSADGISVAHMGDIGCEPTKEQKEKLKGVDVMLMPVGGFYTLEPKEVKALVEELKPRVLIPMHYRSSSFGFDTIGTLEDYLALCDDVVRYGGPTFTPEKDMPRQTAVLSLT